MKMINLSLIALLTSLLFGSCRQPGPFSPDPPIVDQDTVFELVWATRMNYEREIVNLSNGISYNDWFLYPGDLDEPPTIMAFNKDTGEKDWELLLEHLPGREIDYMFRSGDILLARNGHLVFAIDLEFRELLWSKDLKSIGMRLGTTHLASNGNLYHEADFGWQSGFQVQHLFEFDVLTGDYRIVYSNSQDSLGTKSISPPGYAELDETDMLIFNEFPNADSPPEQATQNLVAIDLDSEEVLWRTEDFTEYFYSNSLHPPIVYDNRIVITGGDWSIYAFDVQTGARLWRYEFDYPWAIWANTNHLIHENRLYVNNGQEDVTCLDPETGELIWNNPKGGPNCTDNMVYYEKEDLLVFTSWGYGSVMILDALTGETLHREHRFDNSSYNNDVVYDEERDMFFTSTYKHAIGFRVRRP